MTSLYRIRTEITGVQGAPYLSTMNFLASAGVVESAATAVANFWGVLDNLMNASARWTVLADAVTFDDATGVITAAGTVNPATAVGSGTGEMLPPANQGLVRWRTGTFIDGRELRGRTFAPAIVEAEAAAGRPSTNAVTTMNNAVNSLLSTALTDLVIWRRPVKNAAGAITRPGSHAVVTSGAGWNDFAVLRSRRD